VDQSATQGTAAARLHGVMAEYPGPAELLDAARAAYAAGYRRMEAYSPMPVHGLAEAIGQVDSRVQRAVLAGGLVGLVAGFGLAYYTSGVEVTWLAPMFSGYPHNIGGRPLNSWPSFIVPTFETTVLFAGITALVSMLFFNGLPMPYHPVFNVERFREHASTDAFFLCIEAADPAFDPQATRRFLADLGAIEVSDVPA
jgi:hypothetical protein